MLALANSALPTSCSRQKRSPYATPNCSRSLLCNTHSCTSVQTQVSPLQAWKQTPLDESRNLFHLSRHAMSSCMRLRDEAYQSSHSFLGAVKLHKGHAAGPAISMHYKVDAIRPHSVACKEPAAMHTMSPQSSRAAATCLISHDQDALCQVGLYSGWQPEWRHSTN